MSTYVNKIKRQIAKAGHWVKKNKWEIVGICVGGGLIYLGVKSWKTTPTYTIGKDNLDIPLDLPKEGAEHVWRVIDIDPDMLSEGMPTPGEIAKPGDVILSKCFEDIQSAGGYLMDNWDKIPCWKECGHVAVVKDCGANQNEIQLFAQLC